MSIDLAQKTSQANPQKTQSLRLDVQIETRQIARFIQSIINLHQLTSTYDRLP
jgi:hypothetical protein